MTEGFSRIPDGSVTSAQGFSAGATRAGIKPSGNPDLGLLYSEAECVAAATFTQNAFAAAPVVLSRGRLASGGRAQAIVFNAGNANACSAEEGMAGAEEMTRLAAEKVGVAPEQVLVASTGIIGHPLPMDLIEAGLQKVTLRADGGHEAAQAIMTTDTRPKESAVSLQVAGREVRIGAMAKGVGMIHPNMATMLAFIATDAALDPAFAATALKRAVNDTFNMVTVDADTSTNDSCFLLANGLSGIEPLAEGSADAPQYELALKAVCTDLARAMARDGEGASKLIQVDVTGARTDEDARVAARAVVKSNLVKAAVYGEDPNWGRVFMAVGNSGAHVDPTRAALWIGAVQVASQGTGTGVEKATAAKEMAGEEVQMRVDLGLGAGSARAWGCDLTEKYVVENSAYTT